MIERILFVIADDVTDETVLAVLSAIQAYERGVVIKNQAWNHSHKQNRKLDFKMYLMCPNSDYDILFNKCLDTVEEIVHKPEEIQKIDYTYAAFISIKEAIDIGFASKRPLAESIGILIGSEAPSLPDVSNLVTAFELKYTLGVHVNLLSSIPVHVEKVQAFSEHLSTIEEKIAFVYSCKAVIGFSSFETYLASALKKPVLEIQTSFYLFKWSNPKYFCISVLVSESPHFFEILKRGIDVCLSAIE